MMRDLFVYEPIVVEVLGHVPSGRAENCGQWMPFVSRLTGRIWGGQSMCSSWDCDTHGLTKAAAFLSHYAKVFGALDRIWVAHTSPDWAPDVKPHRSRTLDRLRNRRRLAKGGQCLWVRRHDDELIVFSDIDLSGRDAPTSHDGVWVKPQKALYLLRKALGFPGVVASLSSLGWRLPKKERQSDSWTPGPMSDTFERALQIVLKKLQKIVQRPPRSRARTLPPRSTRKSTSRCSRRQSNEHVESGWKRVIVDEFPLRTKCHGRCHVGHGRCLYPEYWHQP